MSKPNIAELRELRIEELEARLREKNSIIEEYAIHGTPEEVGLMADRIEDLIIERIAKGESAWFEVQIGRRK